MIEAQKKAFNIRILIATRRYLFFSIGAGILGLLILFVGVMPQITTAIGLYEDIADQQPKLEALQRKIRELEQITFTPEFAQAEIVELALPSRKPLLELLTSLNTISVKNAVVLEDFSLSPGLVASTAAQTVAGQEKGKSNSQNTTDMLDVQMTVSGSYAQVSSFLVDIEKIVPFTTIQSMRLESKILGDDFNQETDSMRAQLITRTHFFTQAVSAAVEAPLPALNQKEQAVLAELAEFLRNDLPEQVEVTGGGLQDLFKIDPLEFQ